MQTRHVLTFNWHDPYLYLFSQTGFQISVGDWMRRADGTTGWDTQKRPLPDPLTLLKSPEEVVAGLKKGAFDVVVCHTMQDLSFVAPFDVPTVYLTHNALQNDGLNDAKTMVTLQRDVQSFLRARNGVFAAISAMKLKSWGIDGFVVKPGIGLHDYDGYTGEEPAAISVGNLFVERDHMLGYRYLKEILDGLPHRLVGENPRLSSVQKAKSWDDLKALLRRHRVYVNTTVEAFEDGYNLGMLEAMATGMPVVCLANASSPIVDGVNGYISSDIGYLKNRVQALLSDLSMAKKLGQQARQTVAEQFSVAAFKDQWHEIVETCISRHHKRQIVKAPAVFTRAEKRLNGKGQRQLNVLISQVSNPIGIGRYYVDAFRKVHQVITCGPMIDAQELAQWREAEKQHAFKRMEAAEAEKLMMIERLAKPSDIPMPRGQVDVGQVLAQLPSGWQPDLFVWIDSATGFLPMGLEKLDCPTACLVGDTHTGQMKWRIDYAKLFSHVFVMFTRQHIPHFQQAGCNSVHWLPGACDPAIHGRVLANKTHDIGFVGQTHRQWHPHRVRLLQKLMDAGFDVHVESKILEDMALFFSRSRIVFNRSLNEDLNMRTFEALCSGSLLLTDRLPVATGLEDLFQDRKHLVMYDEDQLEELARYYLDHETEREAIAAAGREAVLQNHTYAHRADQIAEAIFGDGFARCVSDHQNSGQGQPAGSPEQDGNNPMLDRTNHAVEGTVAQGAGTLETAIAELVAYTGDDPVLVQQKLNNAGHALKTEWRGDKRQTGSQIDAFYQQTEHYLYDLTQFNYSPMYVGWRGAIYNVCQQMQEGQGRVQVLDYGGGIGTTLISVSDIAGIDMTYADLPGKTFDYAQWRFKQRGLQVQTIRLGEGNLSGQLFDVITCLDVIEHLMEPEKAVRDLIDHLRPGGLLILTVTFYAPEPDMMHLNLDRYTNEQFYKLVCEMGMAELTSFSPRVFQKTVQSAKDGVRSAECEVRSVKGDEGKTMDVVRAFLKKQKGPIRLNLGCGEDRRQGYINVDAFVPTADLVMDVFDLPLDDAVVDEIFSSHMLEHLGKFEVPNVLKAWHRVLKPGGVLRLNVPDLEWAMDQWVKLPEEHRWGWALDTIYGLQTHAGEYHKTGFTVVRIEALLKGAGFEHVHVSWVWSHGLRCLWAEATRPKDGTVSGQNRQLPMDRFLGQFTTDLSDLSPYTAEDVLDFLQGNWQIGLVSFEHLPMDQADYTVNVALKNGERQMVLPGIRIVGAKQNPMAIFPPYLQGLNTAIHQRIGQAIGQALSKKLTDAQYRDGDFVTAKFGALGNLGLEKTGERVVPGLTDYSLYIPHLKRYLLAERFAKGAVVLDAGCGTGYGAKRLSHMATHVDAVDVDDLSIAFAKRTYGDDKITYQVADLRTFSPRENAYDLVTSFEVIEHLSSQDIPAYLDRLHRALKPGGVVLISTPNKKVSEKWQNPHHLCEMTRDVFEARLSGVFGDVTMLGQAPWSPKVELPGQCAISGRVTDEDDMYVAVCYKREVMDEFDVAPRVSIVMPLFNKAAYTEACLKGLEITRGETPFEVVLVDNGSTDETGDLLDRAATLSGYRILRNKENLGFAKGNNAGAQMARGEFLMFLNNDTLPHEGWLDAMVAEMDGDDRIGIVGARLLYPDTGHIQHAGLELMNGVPDHVYRHAPANAPEVMSSRDLDMVTGACLLIRKNLFEQLGGFDTGYVNGVEDVDLCLRVRDLGYRVRYCAKAVVDHYEGTSEGRFAHVRPNLERFAKRWNGRFDKQGKFVPGRHDQGHVTSGKSLMGDVVVPVKTPGADLRGVWEGTQFVYHSLSLINMALTSELIKAGCELSLIPYEPATFGPDVDPERYEPITKRLHARLSGPAQFHVRHQWPPQFTPPPEGHWIMIQPWEFGHIPKTWVQPIQDQVDELWVPSTYAKQCYVDSGIDANRVQVIPNGVRTDVFKPDADPLVIDTHKTFKFLFVGGAIHRKGIDVLLQVYCKTFTRHDDVCLVVKTMGDASFYKGQNMAEVIKQIQANPNAPEIVHLSHDMTDGDMAGLYRSCDCLVHPYRGEGFGMTVAEAMACGLPVIVTKGGACDDFCSDDNAYFVSAIRKEIAFEMETVHPAWVLEPNAHELAVQMKAVLSDPDTRRAKGQKGSLAIRQNLTWAHVAQQVMARLRAVQKTPVRRLHTKQEDTQTLPVDVFVLAEHTMAVPESISRFTNGAICVVTGEHGWAGALNQKLGNVQNPYIALLRSDVVTTGEWLVHALAHFEADEHMAIVVPRLPVSEGGQATKAKYQSNKRELQRFAKRVYQREQGACADVLSVRDACVVIRRDVLQTFGGFDGGFLTGAFLDDLARRCRQMGRRVVCAHDVFVHCEDNVFSEAEKREREAIAHLEEGDGYRARGDAERSLACYRAALDAKEDYLEAALIYSAVLLEQNRPKEAVDMFHKLVANYPQSSRLHNYLGRCLFMAGDHKTGREEFERAIELDANFGEAYSNLGVLLWENGQLDAALENMNRAAEVSPQSPDVIYNIGMIYAQLGQAKLAADVLKHYLTLSPNDLYARTYLAIILLENGAEQDGMTELEYVLEKDPNHAEAQRVLSQLKAAADGEGEG